MQHAIIIALVILALLLAGAWLRQRGKNAGLVDELEGAWHSAWDYLHAHYFGDGAEAPTPPPPPTHGAGGTVIPEPPPKEPAPDQPPAVAGMPACVIDMDEDGMVRYREVDAMGPEFANLWFDANTRLKTPQRHDLTEVQEWNYRGNVGCNADGTLPVGKGWPDRGFESNGPNSPLNIVSTWPPIKYEMRQDPGMPEPRARSVTSRPHGTRGLPPDQVYFGTDKVVFRARIPGADPEQDGAKVAAEIKARGLKAQYSQPGTGAGNPADKWIAG